MPGRYVRPKGNTKLTLLIIVIGGTLGVILDLFVFGGWQYIKPNKYDYVEPPAPAVSEEVAEVAPVFVPVEEYLGIAPEEFPYEEPAFERQTIAQVNNERYWEQYAASFEPAAGTDAKPRVIIIIDDLGLNRKRSEAVVDLPAPLTLAYLPYARKLEGQTDAARAAGHELLIHTPMEPTGKADPGPGALLDAMSADEIEAALGEMLGSFEGYIGINNHMGSKLTQNSAAMTRIMEMLKARGLVFVDSKTAAGSVAADIARDTGVYYAERDVFLDHEDSPEFVRAALVKLEEAARRNGVAIAIGHPKKNTVAALAEWIPTLEEKGLVLAPVSSVLRHK